MKRGQGGPHGMYDLYEIDDQREFQEPGGRSALRRATRNNPRNLPCPTCGRKNQLTRADVQRGYQCNHCADSAECGF